MARLLALAAVLAGLAAPPAGAYTLKPLASGFDQPVYVTSPPGADALYVVEQPGRIVQLANGRRSTFLDIRRLVRSGGEQGLLSMAFHPEYARNGRFYVNYTDVNGDTRVVEYRRGGARVRQLLFVKQPYANHNGGQVEFGPDGKLYVGMGDGGSGGDPDNRGQNLGDRLAKLLRIDVDAASAPVQVAAYGLRNPWRFSFDRANGDLYIADVGQGAWEEIDYLRGGAKGLPNFGWSVYEGRAKFKDAPLDRRGPLVFPIVQYGHDRGCSVTGGYVYRGSAIAAARGRYFYGDFCSGRIWSLAVRAGRATSVRQEAFSVQNLSSWGEDRRGELYALSLDGQLYRLAP